MYKKLRKLREQLTAIETSLISIAEEEKITLEQVVSEFMGIVKEDCGQYIERPQIGIHIVRN